MSRERGHVPPGGDRGSQHGRTALVLAGGGALGAYEVGVLKALASGQAPGGYRKPFDPDILVGTSVGAFNAAFLAAQTDVSFADAVARLEKVWLERIANRGRGNGVYRFRLDPRHLADPFAVMRDPGRAWKQWVDDVRVLSRYALRQAASWWRSRDKPLFDRVAGLVHLSDLISTRPLGETIRGTVDFRRLHSSPRELIVMVTNWSDSILTSFSNQDLDGVRGADLIRASASLPGLFPPVEIGGKIYVDGSVIMNTPLMPAVVAGAKEIHVVSVNPLMWRGTAKEGSVQAWLRTLGFLWRADLYMSLLCIDYVNRLQGADVGGRVRLPRQGEIALFLHHPILLLERCPSSMLDFSVSQVRRLIKEGFESTRRLGCNTLACQPSYLFPGSLFRNLHRDPIRGEPAG